MGFNSAFKGLIKYNTMEMYGGVEVNCHIFLTLATGGGKEGQSFFFYSGQRCAR